MPRDSGAGSRPRGTRRRGRAGFEPTAFARQLLGHCLRYRARAEHDDPSVRVSPLWDHWTDGVHPELRERALNLVAEKGIRLHSHAAALHSSMVFAFNLFLPPDAGSWVVAALGARFDDVRVDRVDIEWVPPGRYLAEIDGDSPREDESSSAIDAVVWGTRADSRSVAILLEVKLSEGGFTPCGGRESRGNRRRDVCESAATFLAEPTACYLTRPYGKARNRRYWEIFDRAFGSVAQAFPGSSDGPCPFAGDRQQPMRQHALALALEADGGIDEAWLVLVHHDDNPDVLPHWEHYRTTVADSGRIVSLPAGQMIRAGDDAWPLWASYMRERYGL